MTSELTRQRDLPPGSAVALLPGARGVTFDGDTVQTGGVYLIMQSYSFRSADCWIWCYASNGCPCYINSCDVDQVL